MGKAIFSTATANYLNVIQLDRLNKRNGDVFQYSNEDGLWIRGVYEQLGTTGFKVINHGYQGGIDKLYKNDDFSIRFGLSGRVTDSENTYININGVSEIKNYEANIYATYINAHDWYFDITGRAGYIDTTYSVTTEMQTMASAKYDQYFYGLALEGGKRFVFYEKELSKLFFEPQVTLSYVLFGDSAYYTSQNTLVETERLNSLIGRLGFRLGFAHDNDFTFSVKADIMREFMGKQHFNVSDITVKEFTFTHILQNTHDWYDVGITMQYAVNENSYFYIDAEKVFGQDYQDSYKLNAGFRWTF